MQFALTIRNEILVHLMHHAGAYLVDVAGAVHAARLPANNGHHNGDQRE